MSSASYRDLPGTRAENYERYFVPAIASPVSVGLLAAADLRPGERVLDVACGTGLIARLAAAQVGPSGSVTGVDIEPEMIDVAKNVPPPSGPDIEWHVSDAASLPLPDDSRDVVLCQMGLMFMADRPAALAEMRRTLAPGGRLLVSTPGHIQRPLEVMQRAISEHITGDLGGFVGVVFSMPDPDGVATLLRDADLSDVSAAVSTVSLTLPPPAEFLWQYINLTPMRPFVEQASESARSAMEEQVVDGWQPYVVEGATVFDQPMVIATGRK